MVVVVTPGGAAPGAGAAGPVTAADCWNWIVTSWPGAVDCGGGGAGTDIGATGSLLNADTPDNHHPVVVMNGGFEIRA